MSLLLWLSPCTADPLHKHGGEGTWVHADSGWLFPLQVGEFTRIDLPYSIDGNDDVGVEYERVVGESRTRAIVEVFSNQSAAEHATLESSRAAMQSRSGQLLETEPFVIEGQDVEGSRLEFGVTSESGARLYFLRTHEWIVNVRSSTSTHGLDGSDALDAFVRTLPWQSLGSDAGVH